MNNIFKKNLLNKIIVILLFLFKFINSILQSLKNKQSNLKLNKFNRKAIIPYIIKINNNLR